MTTLKKMRGPFLRQRPPCKMVRALRTLFAAHRTVWMEREAVEEKMRAQFPELLFQARQREDLCARLRELNEHGELAYDRSGGGRRFKATAHLQEPDSRQGRPGPSCAASNYVEAEV